jgi:hypothetical protein
MGGRERARVDLAIALAGQKWLVKGRHDFGEGNDVKTLPALEAAPGDRDGGSDSCVYTAP